MKCPYCEKEMTKGAIGPMALRAWTYWVSDAYIQTHPYPPTTQKEQADAGIVPIYTGYGTKTQADPVWYCKDCGKLIGELSDDTTK